MMTSFISCLTDVNCGIQIIEQLYIQIFILIFLIKKFSIFKLYVVWILSIKLCFINLEKAKELSNHIIILTILETKIIEK